MINNLPQYAQCDTMKQLMQLNSSNDRHFFSEGAMNFFNSQVQQLPPYSGCVFVTSEQFDYKTPRFFTVRIMHSDGSVETMSEFQQFVTEEEAHRYAKELSQQI